MGYGCDIRDSWKVECCSYAEKEGFSGRRMGGEEMGVSAFLLRKYRLE